MVAEDVAPKTRVIDVADVAALGSVDAALAQFYDDAVASAAMAAATSEREIREWFDEQLLTEQGVRTQTLDGPGARPADALRALEDAHVIRAETRRGAHWYELAHDRLVAPVRDSNAAWRAAHLSALQLDATAWDRKGRPPELLAAGDGLAAAAAWADTHPDDLLGVDQDFLAASRENEHRLMAVSRASRRVRIFAVVAAVLALLAAIGSVVAWQLKSARDDARRQQRAAQVNETRANNNAAEAAKQRQAAEAGAAAAADAEKQAADEATQRQAAADAAQKSAADAVTQRNAASAAEANAEQQQQAARAAADEAAGQKAIADAAAADARKQTARANAATAQANAERVAADAKAVQVTCQNDRLQKGLDYAAHFIQGDKNLYEPIVQRAVDLSSSSPTAEQAVDFVHWAHEQLHPGQNAPPPTITLPPTLPPGGGDASSPASSVATAC
jgi:hypothetical protein